MSNQEAGTKASLKAHKTLEKEADKHGVTVRAVHFMDLETEGTSGLGKVARTLFGGEVQTTHLQVYELEKGEREIFYIERFENRAFLPGYFHTCVSGALPQAICLARGGWGGSHWIAEDHEELVKRLKKDKAIRKAADKLTWGMQVPGGQIELDWTFQAHALGNGLTHVIVQSGRTLGLIREYPGVGMTLGMLDALEPLLDDADAEYQGLYHPCYEEMYFEWKGWLTDEDDGQWSAP